MKDAGKKISYLKVDVEGAELPAIRNWIVEGLPKTIDQMMIEFHTGKLHVKKWDVVSTLADLIDDLQDLFRIGFKSIFYEPNLCMGKDHDYKKYLYYNYFDVLFYKK
jgi:hypothetical protein